MLLKPGVLQDLSLSLSLSLFLSHVGVIRDNVEGLREHFGEPGRELEPKVDACRVDTQPRERRQPFHGLHLSGSPPALKAGSNRLVQSP